jgi:hypothetical protein
MIDGFKFEGGCASTIDLRSGGTTLTFSSSAISLDALRGSESPEGHIGEARSLSRKTAFIRMLSHSPARYGRGYELLDSSISVVFLCSQNAHPTMIWILTRARFLMIMNVNGTQCSTTMNDAAVSMEG